MTDLRDVIARALHRQATDDGEVHVLWGGVAEHEEEVAEWLPFADAVLAVLADHDAKVRAEALREAAAGLHEVANCVVSCHEADRIALRIRADRIERGEAS